MIAGGALVPGGRGRASKIPQQKIRRQLTNLLPGCLEKKVPRGRIHRANRNAQGFNRLKMLPINWGETVFCKMKEGSQKDLPKSIRVETKQIIKPKGTLSPGKGIGKRKGKESVRDTKA